MNNFWKYSSKFHINLIKNFWSTSSNFVIFTGQLPWYQLVVLAKLRENRLRIDWDTSKNLGKNNDKNAQRSVNTHCGQWVCGYCDCLGISFFFRLTTSDVRIRRQKPPNSEKRVFHISLNKGYIGKAIFSRSFSARYHILKKKKKKNLLGLCRYSVGKYSLTSGNLPCQFELLSHTWTTGGTYSVLFQWRPAFSALWRRGNSVVSVHHINNFWNTLSNFTKFTGQSP